MRFALPPLAELPRLPFDTIIDSRAPSEFAEDHIPGAINLPVLSDAERAQVGTIYVQESAFRARKIGGALVARNIARHLEGPLADRDGAWQPLVYCWRGGQRSGAFGLWLAEIGWRVRVLDGGYQSYRRAVVAQLYDHPLAQRLVLLDGNTGTAKTALLAQVAARGGQALDLEGMANHRGSVLGLQPGGQPSQKMFETRLSAALAACDPTRPVLVEAESSKIGDLLIPPQMWKAMQAAPRIRLTASVADRTRYLCHAYADLFADLPVFTRQLAKLTRLQGRERVTRWTRLAEAGAFPTLVQELIVDHYDPRYRNGGAARTVAHDLTVSLDPAGLAAATDRILALLDGFAPVAPVEA